MLRDSNTCRRSIQPWCDRSSENPDSPSAATIVTANASAGAPRIARPGDGGANSCPAANASAVAIAGIRFWRQCRCSIARPASGYATPSV
jgi:hypothetical protein